jgi:hypothetical protein
VEGKSLEEMLEGDLMPPYVSKGFLEDLQSLAPKMSLEDARHQLADAVIRRVRVTGRNNAPWVRREDMKEALKAYKAWGPTQPSQIEYVEDEDGSQRVGSQRVRMRLSMQRRRTGISTQGPT